MTKDTGTSFGVEWRGYLAAATPAQIDRFIASLAPGEAARLVHEWSLWARPSQLPPCGDWRVWLLMAGRGFGKTRAGAEWVRSLATSGTAKSVALVGDTAEDVRQVMIEGPSGVLAVTPPATRPAWHRSLRRLDWPSGMVTRCYSAADPEQLRGPEFDHAWADEIDLLLSNDVAIATEVCADIFGASFAGVSVPRRVALLSMAFNMGGPRLAGFRQMRAAIAAGDWDRAAAEALDSRWARQTGKRAGHIAAMLRSG